eukprot:symbB.v1.2.007538.t2/scaffold464.1/size201063/7
MSEALGAPQEGSVPGDPSADIVLERPVPADQSAEIVPDGQSGATETDVLAESTEEQDVWVEQGRPRALTAPEAEDECDESPLAALRKSKTVDVDQEEGQKAGKMKKKVVKKKKKIVSIDAKAEVEVEVLEAIVAEMPEVDGVVPEVIGRSLTSVTVQSEPRSVIVEEMPPRMPPDLPFHFRLDVGALRIGTGKTFPSDWWNKLSSSLEKEWRYCRKDQERAWVNHKELPCEIRDAAKRNGKSLEDVFGGIRQRKEESWQKICPQRGTVRTYPMKVLKFETAPGRKLQQEDLEGAKEDIWCHMTYDLKDDPLLKDMGHEGPTIFSALMLFYISYSEWDSKSAMEIRVSHIDHFEFALCFPTAPYPLCQLEAPEFDFGRYFEVDLAGGEQALESMMSQVRPLLTWLFWDCFDELFSEEVKRTNTSRAAHATGLAYKVRSLVTSQTKLKDRHDSCFRWVILSRFAAMGSAQCSDGCVCPKGEADNAQVVEGKVKDFAKTSSALGPTYVFEDGATYSGQWNGNVRHGFGVHVEADGSRYEGQWADDKAHGTGRLEHSDGATYDGNWRSSMKHGQGTYAHSDGSTYTGDWLNDLQSGNGNEEWSDGASYSGQYLAGRKNGKGKYTWPNGSYFEGDFVDNDIHGYGTYVWTDGCVYEGQWAKQEMDGEGVFQYPDGRKYEGSYVKNQKHGHGKLSYPDGRIFEGNFAEGEMHGYGELKQCQERPEALASLLSLVRAQAFKFPFRGRVSKEDARNYRLDICNKEESNGPNEPWEPLKSNDELDLLAAVELAAQNAIKDYVHALEEEGGLLPRQWTMEAPLKLRSAGKKLVEKVAPVQLIEKDGTEKLQMKELALIECVGAIQLDRRPRPKETEYRQVTAEVSEANEVLEDAQGMPSVADAEEAEEEEKGLEYEQKAMVLTADLSGWPGEDGELVVGDFNLNDQHSIRDALTAVEHMENLMWDEDTMRPCLKEKLSRLAFGLRALQRASMKLQLRSVGLAVLETQREVAATSASDVFLERVYQRLSGRPKKVAEGPGKIQKAERAVASSRKDPNFKVATAYNMAVRKLRRRVLPNKADDEFLGGFVRKQFDQEGPLQRYWVETYQMPYAYRPFFQPPSPHIDPAALLSSAERKYLVKSFITDPLSETLGPGGTVDPRHGGANMDPRQLLTDGIINEGLLHLHSQMSAIHLTNGFVYPWRFRGWRHYYLVSWCRCDTELVRHHFGPKIGSYFEFVETYITFLFIASVLGIVAEISGPPNGPGKHGFWKFVQPIFGVCMSMWGTFFCIFWRRRCAWLSHIWGNGWIEDGEEMRGAGSLQSGSSQVRPEFALQWRQSFEQAKPARQEETLKMLKTLLRAPNTQHFDDRALTCDIMRFDEACYLSDFVQLYRFVLSYLASGCFILLASGATYGALAANQLLGLNGKTAGYAVTGLTTSVLVPVLNVIHYQVVIKTNNYQLFREDSEREKDFFDRLFVFNLFNTYNSLIWIAFVERNMEQVRVQVFFLLLSSIFINNMLEFYWSHAVKQLKKMGHGNTNSIRQMLRYILVGEIEDIVINPMDPIKTALEHVTDEMTRDAAFELVDEAIELVIQYGLIMMFTVAFPLAPVLALVNVHIEKRLDAYKLVKLMQSPEPRMVVGMGRAFNAFVVVTGLGLVVSGLLLYFAQYPGDTCETCTMFGNCGACAGTSVELILPEFSTEERLFLLGAGEHAMLILMYACFTSASVGKDIIHEQYRQRFYENRLESMESGKDSHHRRRSTYYG